jgi:uncharacterized protein
MNAEQVYKQLSKKGLSEKQKTLIENELGLNQERINKGDETVLKSLYSAQEFYDITDFQVFYQRDLPSPQLSLRTLEELIERDKQREKDGFPRRIRLGKYVKSVQGKKGKVVIVPTTTEAKFYHDNSLTEDGEGPATGGTGKEEEGEVIGQEQAQPQPGEGEGQGAGQGSGGEHDMGSQAFDLGKVLTEKFHLPNLKDKGKKKSFTKYTYDLTDINRRTGQVLDKKATLRKVIKTNILLGRINPEEGFDPASLIINPRDEIYRILSREKDFETQAIVFFLRDYSGSMQGDPTEVISTQHLFIYSWLMFQYQNNVETRFILHDTEAKEVADFESYYKSNVAGGTRVAPAFQLVNKIVEEEQLARFYNIYVFHGTDGDDWDNDGKELIESIEKVLSYCNRIGITVAKNSWGSSTGQTTVEKNLEASGLLKSRPGLIRLDAFPAAGATENRIIESIRELVS